MKKELDAKQLFLLKALITSNGRVFIGSLTFKFKISIRDAAQSFNALRAYEFVQEIEDEIVLTKIGREWIYSNQSLFNFDGERYWRKVPERFLGPKIPPFAPYLPSRSKLPSTGLGSRQPRRTK